MASIRTSRTILRRLEISDFQNMRLLDADPDIMKFTPARFPQTEVQTRTRIASQIANQKSFEPFGIWVAEAKEDSELTAAFVGWFMLMPKTNHELELGFMITRANWNKGLATEIGLALIEYARDRDISKLTAHIDLDNLASQKTIRKLGFNYKEDISIPNKATDSIIQVQVYELGCKV